jgi:hypothetical protein
MTMMPNLTLEINPVVVRKENTKRNDFADHHLAHGIEVTAAFGKICDAGGMSFFAAMPHRIQMNAKSGFRTSIVHEPKLHSS